jgi:hypothetical protein
VDLVVELIPVILVFGRNILGKSLVLKITPVQPLARARGDRSAITSFKHPVWESETVKSDRGVKTTYTRCVGADGCHGWGMHARGRLKQSK